MNSDLLCCYHISWPEIFLLIKNRLTTLIHFDSVLKILSNFDAVELLFSNAIALQWVMVNVYKVSDSFYSLLYIYSQAAVDTWSQLMRNTLMITFWKEIYKQLSLLIEYDSLISLFIKWFKVIQSSLIYH